MKITFPYWGNYTIAFKVLFETLGLTVIVPEKTNSKTIEQGAKLSPELFCFPFKVNVGNYLSAIEKGADTIFMWENVKGNCRLRYYWVVQEKVLRGAGFDVKVINLNSKNLFSEIKKIKNKNKISTTQCLKAFFLAFKIIKFVEQLEKKANFLRPREIETGQTDRILSQCFEKLSKSKNFQDISLLQKQTFQKLSQIKIDKKLNPPKVGLIGEIYVVSDSAINFDLEKKMGQQGIEVHREMNLSYHLKRTIFPWVNWSLQKKIKPYLRSTVGGHGREAIKEMLGCVKNDFDGIIQLLPFGCLPETTVRPILEKIHKESNIPFLSLSLDEQSAEAGINTRIEAFVDVVKNYYENKKSKTKF